MNIKTKYSVQGCAEGLAALEIGNQSLQSEEVQKMIDWIKKSIDLDSHYLFCVSPNPASRFTGCGTIEGLVDVMVEDKKIWYAILTPKEGCSNCTEPAS